jgi:hypothetical protein
MTLLVTLRSDYYGRAIAIDRELSTDLPDSQVNLGPIRREELREVIEKPAAVVGLKLEEGLIERMLDDVGDEPGNLPLLEYALTELWKARSGNLMTFAAYCDIGQVSGALANRANALLGELSEGQKTAARRLMLRLVRVSDAAEEGADTRRRARRDELDAEAWKLVDFFTSARARLLIADKDPVSGIDTVEVAHEALIRKWDRLRQWLDENRQFLLWRQRLAIYRNSWEAAGREDEGTLLRGRLASEAQTWLRSRRAELSAAEREYIEKSGAAVSRFRTVWRTAAAAAIVAGMISLAWFLWSRTDQYNIDRILAKDWEETAVAFAFAQKSQNTLHQFSDLVALSKLGRDDDISGAINSLPSGSHSFLDDWTKIRDADAVQPKFNPRDLRHDELQPDRQERSLGQSINWLTFFVQNAKEMAGQDSLAAGLKQAFSRDKDPAAVAESLFQDTLTRGLKELRDCSDPLRQAAEPDADDIRIVAKLEKLPVIMSDENRALMLSTAARRAACEGAHVVARDLTRQAAELSSALTGDESARIRLDAAVVDAMLGNRDRALTAALALGPAHAIDEVGLAFAKQGDIDSAVRVLVEIQKQDDAANDLIAAIAKELIFQKRAAEVQPFVMKRSRGNPEKFTMWRRVFEMLVESESVDEAAGFAQAMRAAAPHAVIVDVFGDLCVIRSRTGRAREAAEMYDVAAATATADPWQTESNRVTLAIALAEMGRIREARAMAGTIDSLINQYLAEMGILRAYTDGWPSQLW